MTCNNLNVSGQHTKSYLYYFNGLLVNFTFSMLVAVTQTVQLAGSALKSINNRVFPDS